jgi:nucleoside-diphosphate-sugar epimerase
MTTPVQARWLITGGAGFLGINVVRHLLDRGQEVVVLDTADFAYPERDRVTVYRGDIRDVPMVERATAGCRYVVHAAAALPLYSAHDIRTTDIDGTRNVLAAALAAGVERVIQISSTAVYGVPDHHPLREEDPMRGVGEYGRAKVAAEELCLEYRKRGLCVPVLRPKSFVGPERLGVFAIFYDWAYNGHHFPLPGGGNNRYQLLDVADLCDAIFLSATVEAERANHTFNIGAREFGTLRQDFQAVLDEAGHNKRIIPLPAAPLVGILRLLERFKLSPIYQWVYETVTTDSYVSVERAERLLGFRPRHSNRDALIGNYQWYVANRHRFDHSRGFSHRAPWKEGVLRLARVVF